jgi:hypothetical protein
MPTQSHHLTVRRGDWFATLSISVSAEEEHSESGTSLFDLLIVRLRERAVDVASLCNCTVEHERTNYLSSVALADRTVEHEHTKYTDGPAEKLNRKGAKSAKKNPHLKS